MSLRESIRNSERYGEPVDVSNSFKPISLLKVTDYIMMGLILIGVFIYGNQIRQLDNVWNPIFFERDPALSYPMVKSQVSYKVLFELSMIFPSMLILLFGITKAYDFRGSFFSRKSWNFSTLIFYVYWLIKGLLLATFIATAINTTIKITTCRPRPNVFAYGNYSGYQDTYQTNDYTYYFNQTSEGKIGSYDKFMADQRFIMDAFRSFPSGHSTLIWSAMTYTMYIVRELIMIPNRNWISLKNFFSFTLLFLAGWVSVTRIQDYKHHPIDVFCGASLGIIVAYLTWTKIRQIMRRH
jgi:membrane-associated phospholipid phosphatase